MSDIGDEVFFRVGGILHEARMRECYGNMQISSRMKWPETFKDFRGQRHDGQPWIDVAIAQVRALIKAGLILPAATEIALSAVAGIMRQEHDSGDGHFSTEHVECIEALVAQRIEQGSSKPEVAGSIPAERANPSRSSRGTE